MAETYHFLHGMTLTGASPITLTQLTDLTAGLNSDVLTGYSAGFPHPLFTGLMGQSPGYPFTTQQLATLLAACSIEGYTAASGNSDLYFRKGKNLGTREALATTVHLRSRITAAFLHWTQISARQGQNAEATCVLRPAYDGSNPIITPAGSVAASAITPAAAEQFTLGPVSINSTVLDGVKEWTISSGIELVDEACSGNNWPTLIGIAATKPMLTIVGLSLEALGTFGVLGTAISAITAYARRKAPDGDNYGDGASQHLKFVGGGGIVLPNEIRVGANKRGETTLMIPLRSASASGLPVTITTGQTIT